MICLFTMIMCMVKMIFLLRCDYVHDAGDLFVHCDYVRDKYDLLLRCDYVHDEDGVFVKMWLCVW